MIRPLRLTVRTRIALVITALVVAAGIVLLMASYELVRININSVPKTPPPPRTTSTPHMVPAGSSAPSVRALIAHQTLSTLVWQYAAIVAALLAVSVVVAWLVAGRILGPIRAITATARRITSEDLHQRLSLHGPDDELGELGNTLDAMLERLETAFHDEQLFSASAAHQLRTPLAVLGAELELMATGTEREEVRATASRMRKTIVDTQHLLERLLTLTRGSVPPDERRLVRLDQLVAERLGLFARHTDERSLTVIEDLAPVTVLGDQALLAELIDNLIDNAIMYNCPGGHIEIRTQPVHTSVVLTVSNSGPLIRSGEVLGLLEPFRRANQQRVGKGYGLGLSVVRAVAKVHDGQLDVKAPDDGGLHVRITFATSGYLIPDTTPPHSPSASMRPTAPDNKGIC